MTKYTVLTRYGKSEYATIDLAESRRFINEAGKSGLEL